MKKTFKKLCLLAGAALFASALLFTNLTGLGVARAAFLDAGYNTVITTAGFKTEYDLGETVTLPKADNDFIVVVKGPNGEVTPSGSDPLTVTADYAGWYTVDYYKKIGSGDDATSNYATTRTLRFHVTAPDYSIEVAHGGAGIPTFVATNKPVVLPAAKLIYTDAKGVVREETNESKNIKINVTGAGFAALDKSNGTDADRTFTTADYSGKYTVKYFYAVNGKAMIQKDFSMSVDATYTPSQDKPTLSVSGVPSAGTLYTKLTMPAATATDKRDTNVKITVSVKDPNDGTVMYTVREDKMLDETSGYILDKYKDSESADFYTKDDANKVGFEASRDMTFYPHVLSATDPATGKYEVTYTATNDDGQTDSKSFPITVTRAERPRIKIDSTEIPSKWAMNTITKRAQQYVDNDGDYTDVSDGSGVTSGVKKYNRTDNPEAFDLYLPFLDKTDDYVIANAKPASEFTNVEVAFKKPDESTWTVMTTMTKTKDLPNTFKTDADGKLRDSDNKWVDSAGYFLDDNGKTIPEHLEYYSLVADGKGVDDGFGGKKDSFVIPVAQLGKLGDYEIRYTAERDSESPSTAVTYYTVALAADMEDKEAPFVTVDNLQKYVKFGETFNKPAVKISDNVGAVRTETRYFLYESNDVKAELSADAFYNGKIDKFDYATVQEYLEFNFKKDPIAQSGGDVSPAIADEAAFRALTSIKTVTFAVDAVGNKKFDSKTETKLIDTLTTQTEKPVLDEDSIKNGLADTKGMGDPRISNDGKISGKFDLKDGNGWYSIKGIKATLSRADDYLGYEIVVRKNSVGLNGYGEIVNDVESTFWVDSYNYDMRDQESAKTTHTDERTLHIDDFSFKPTGAGTYSISINVFDVTGSTASQTLFLDVIGKTSGVESTASSTLKLPATVELGSSVSLPKKSYYYYDDADQKVVPENPDQWGTDTADKFGEPQGTDEQKAANYGHYTEYIYRTTVIGHHFSISGRDLTAWATGEYRIVMKPGNVLAGDKSDMATSTDSFKCESTVNPVLQLTGLVPAVSEAIEDVVVIPSVVASSLSGVAETGVPPVKVLDGSSKEVAVSKYETTDPDDDKKGWWEFKPNQDATGGKYTVTYSVTSVNGQETTQTYTIDIGDVFMPEITIDPNEKVQAYLAEYKIEDSKTGHFNFIKVKAADAYFAKNDATGKTDKLMNGADARDVTGDVEMKLILNGETKFNNTRGGQQIPATDHVFDTPGDYTVEYSVTDKAGNKGVKTFTIKVIQKNTGKVISDKALAVIFSVLGVVVIGGLVFYFVGVRRKNTR